MYGDHRSKQAHRWVDTVEATKDLYVTAALGTNDDDDDDSKNDVDDRDDTSDDDDDDDGDEFDDDEDDDSKYNARYENYFILFYRYESASLKS